ncbi:MAG: cysteine peptidase family C39 domain-containing protein, partial [Acidobacteriota bacterium]|nr:cysteine peptidase family C39 domain-containing protein [Acidobacteriota bacterium]
MIARTTHCVTIAAVILMAAMAVPSARAQTPGADLRLLDVPYLPQSEALCGGAAIAMVMRFFGATNVYAETFSDLVDREAAGIRGKDLLTALQTRGWQAQSFRGDASLVQAHLQARRPVVALIEDRPGRYHYVVIVGWSAGRIIVHDPAKAPFRILDEAQFSKAWSESGFWTLVTTPPAEPSSSEPVVRSLARPDSTPDTSGTCPAMVDEGVRLAAKGDLEGGRRLLEVAAAACPASAAPWREIAGIHALKSEWRQAADDARQALAKDAADPLASRILATALYLDGDSDGALTAWNHVGEPSIDLVNVTGLERTRYLVVAREMGLRPQILLTRAALEAARRRLAELPAAQTTRVSYRPGENGRAQVDAVVLERPRFPVGPIPLAATALRALTDRELAASIASPTGGGELWSASWRWWEHRPRVAGSFAAPSPYGGVWRMEAFAEKQSYADGSAIVQESRRRAAFQA